MTINKLVAAGMCLCLTGSIIAQDQAPPRSEATHRHVGGHRDAHANLSYPTEIEYDQGILGKYLQTRDAALYEAQLFVDSISDIWSDLDDHGIKITGEVVIDMSDNWHGGRSTNGSALGHLLDIGIEIDLELAAGIEGARAFIDFQNQNGESGSVDAGDFQGVSNISTDGRTQIAELWYEQTFADGQIRVLIGKRDLNQEFAFTEYGGVFMNNAFGQSPTIFVMPTYPDPSTGALVFVNLDNPQNEDIKFNAGLGIFDGASQEGVRTGSRGPSTLYDDPADLFVIGEFGMSWGNTDTSIMPGRLAIGGWGHTGTFSEFSGGDQDGTEGFYLVIDQLIHSENPEDPENKQGIGVFLQYGYADEDVSPVEHHVGGGIQATGLLEGKDQDIAGLGITYASFSDDAPFSADEEITIEAFYEQHLTRFLSLQNDLQYVINPGGTDRKDALVSSTRAVIKF